MEPYGVNFEFQGCVVTPPDLQMRSARDNLSNGRHCALGVFHRRRCVIYFAGSAWRHLNMQSVDHHARNVSWPEEEIMIVSLYDESLDRYQRWGPFWTSLPQKCNRLSAATRMQKEGAVEMGDGHFGAGNGLFERLHDVFFT